jgi:hypothetical protein
MNNLSNTLAIPSFDRLSKLHYIRGAFGSKFAPTPIATHNQSLHGETG